jgi:hypothetical protein
MILDSDDDSRKWLRAIQALTTDVDGDEVFLGLTYSESVFYLKQSQRLRSELDSSELWLYLQITDRHLKARLGNLVIGIVQVPV